MCFSAIGSLITGSLLLPTGVYCVYKSYKFNNRFLIFATLPLLFSIQQFIEGILWLNINGDNIQIIKELSFAYLFFSHFLWLIIIPLAILPIEIDNHKIFICKICLIAGVALGTYYFSNILNYNSYTAYVKGHSIVYKLALKIHNPEISLIFEQLPYPIIVLTPLLGSSLKYIRILGSMAAVSMLVTYYFYNYAFISVWCFSAAIISLYISYMFSNAVYLQKY
jgi:hypothetical protein